MCQGTKEVWMVCGHSVTLVTVRCEGAGACDDYTRFETTTHHSACIYCTHHANYMYIGSLITPANNHVLLQSKFTCLTTPMEAHLATLEGCGTEQDSLGDGLKVEMEMKSRLAPHNEKIAAVQPPSATEKRLEERVAELESRITGLTSSSPSPSQTQASSTLAAQNELTSQPPSANSHSRDFTLAHQITSTVTTALATNPTLTALSKHLSTLPSSTEFDLMVSTAIDSELSSLKTSFSAVEDRLTHLEKKCRVLVKEIVTLKNRMVENEKVLGEMKYEERMESLEDRVVSAGELHSEIEYLEGLIGGLISKIDSVPDLSERLAEMADVDEDGRFSVSGSGSGSGSIAGSGHGHGSQACQEQNPDSYENENTSPEFNADRVRLSILHSAGYTSFTDIDRHLHSPSGTQSAGTATNSPTQPRRVFPPGLQIPTAAIANIAKRERSKKRQRQLGRDIHGLFGGLEAQHLTGVRYETEEGEVDERVLSVGVKEWSLFREEIREMIVKCEVDVKEILEGGE